MLRGLKERLPIVNTCKDLLLAQALPGKVSAWLDERLLIDFNPLRESRIPSQISHAAQIEDFSVRFDDGESQ